MNTDTLKKKRGEALATVMADKGLTQIELARQMTDTERDAQTLRKRISNAVNQRRVLSVGFCFQIERHLSLPNGTLVCQVQKSEQAAFEELCKQYGVSEKDAVAISSSRDPTKVARGRALRQAMEAAGLDKNQLSKKISEKGKALSPSSISNMMLGWNNLSESWAVTMAPILGVSPSVLLATERTPLAEEPSETPQVTGSDTSVSLTLEDLGVKHFGDVRFMFQDGQFSGPDGFSLVRQGDEYVLSISVEKRIPLAKVADLVLR